MEKFCFANFRQIEDGDGWEPDLPDCIESYLAWTPEKNYSQWCLCLVFCRGDCEKGCNLEWVAEDLSLLLDSAKNNYPPALAMALHNAELEEHSSKSEYSKSLSVHLKRFLRGAERDSSILVEVARTDLGYLRQGEFVWALRYDPNNDEVLWVSDDFQIYNNPSSDFILTMAQKQALQKS